MSVESDIFEGVFSLLAQSAIALPIAYPGVAFTPPADGSGWIEVRLFPNETTEVGLANDGPVVHRGFAQVNVVARPGGGIVDPVAIASAVAELFAKGAQLSLVATVYRKPWISALVDDTQAGKMFVPVTIPYRAVLENQVASGNETIIDGGGA